MRTTLVHDRRRWYQYPAEPFLTKLFIRRLKDFDFVLPTLLVKPQLLLKALFPLLRLAQYHTQ